MSLKQTCSISSILFLPQKSPPKMVTRGKWSTEVPFSEWNMDVLWVGLEEALCAPTGVGKRHVRGWTALLLLWHLVSVIAPAACVLDTLLPKSSCGRALTGSTVEPTAMARELCLGRAEVRGCDPGVLGGVMSDCSSSLRLFYTWGWWFIWFSSGIKEFENPTACLKI